MDENWRDNFAVKSLPQEGQQCKLWPGGGARGKTPLLHK